LNSAPLKSIEYSQRELPSGIIEYRFTLACQEAASLLEKLPSNLHRYLVVNLKRHGDATIPGWGTARSTDLFENAPKEIRESDSLFVGRWEQDESNPEAITQILASDSKILLLSDLDLPTLIEKQKIAWAWFSRPSIFHHQLMHGSGNLTKTLFAGTKFAILGDRSSMEVLVYGFTPISI